ncbi:MAG: hypothetical protein WAO71_16020 [Gallionella sp.]
MQRFRTMHQPFSIQNLQEIPAIFNEGVFPQLFETAKLACSNAIQTRCLRNSEPIDHLDGSITNTARQEGRLPLGNSIAIENLANQGTLTFNLRFSGAHFDPETGLHYNINRDYNNPNDFLRAFGRSCA